MKKNEQFDKSTGALVKEAQCDSDRSYKTDGETHCCESSQKLKEEAISLCKNVDELLIDFDFQMARLQEHCAHFMKRSEKLREERMDCALMKCEH